MITIGILLGLGICCYENLKQFDGKTGFYYTQDVATRNQQQSFWETASEDAKREIQGLVLFRNETGIEMKNKTLNRIEEGDLIETAGNMYLVTPGVMMKGSYVTDSDRNGCMISRKTAENLFGDLDIIGEKIIIRDKSYMVRGIVDVDKSLCMIQGDDDKSYPFVRVDAPRIPVSVVQQMLSGLLPEDCEWISEGDLYYGLGNIVFFLPIWIIFFIGSARCRKAVAGIRNKGLKLILKITVPIIGFTCMCLLFLLSFQFPDDYIPTAWSDFEFWTELVKQKKEMIVCLFENPVQIADSLMIKSLIGLITIFTLLIVLLLLCCKRFDQCYEHQQKGVHKNRLFG